MVDDDRLLDRDTREAEVATVLVLIDELAHTAPRAAQPEIMAVHRALAEARDGLLVFAAALDPIHHDMAGRLGNAGVALVGWAWQRRAILGDGEVLVAQLPVAWGAATRVLLAAWSAVVRASSAVEGWHSVLRPHLTVHRGLSPALLSLLALAHNHRVAPRGIHAGRSPLQRSGLPDARGDWLTVLDYQPARPDALRRAPWHVEQRLAA